MKPQTASKKYTDAMDDAADAAAGIAEGSAADVKLDKKRGVPETPGEVTVKAKMKPVTAKQAALAAALIKARKGGK